VRGDGASTPAGAEVVDMAGGYEMRFRIERSMAMRGNDVGSCNQSMNASYRISGSGCGCSDTIG
jgi:hypothetical protein